MQAGKSKIQGTFGFPWLLLVETSIMNHYSMGKTNKLDMVLLSINLC
jgi:hypothetical protein